MSEKPRKPSLAGFYRLQRGERLDRLAAFSKLPSDQLRIIGQDGALPFEMADLFVENAIGSYPLPLGIVTNVVVNGRELAVPFAVEESSVVAAASNAAKWVKQSGGFEVETLSSLMIGQIQVLDLDPASFEAAERDLLAAKEHLLALANEIHPRLLMRGGGAQDIEVRTFPQAEVPFLVVHVLMDTREAMGANLVNTVCEKLAPEVEEITGGRVGLRILSNLADRKLFRARCRVRAEFLEARGDEDDPHVVVASGTQVARRIYEAFVFADHDPYRAATHNKGIMNGVDPAVIATGNDWRAVSAGVHAYAARSGRYRSLSRWTYCSEDDTLVGELTLPLQLGTVGGVTRLHPLARVSLQILGNPHADELGQVLACTGLASNLAALRALVTTGIQRGHMKLHAKNLALGAGARAKEVETIATQMVLRQTVSATAAENLLAELRGQTTSDLVAAEARSKDA
jgi:hydroxymethylglutaryl-CoA reductase